MLTELQVFRDGHKSRSYFEPLQPGDHGTVQTLEVMARIVREDATQPDLRKFVLKEVVGSAVRGHDFSGEINRCFEFARNQIVYRRDPVGVERVSDLWSTLYALSPGEPEGDCGIKSVFLASCLALVGNRPVFVVIRQTPQDVTFKHVYVGLFHEGKYLPLDPTPQEKPSGYEAQFLARALFPIFT